MSNKSIEELQKEIEATEKEIEASKKRLEILDEMGKITKRKVEAERQLDNFSVGCTIVVAIIILLGCIIFPDFFS